MAPLWLSLVPSDIFSRVLNSGDSLTMCFSGAHGTCRRILRKAKQARREEQRWPQFVRSFLLWQQSLLSACHVHPFSSPLGGSSRHLQPGSL